ncbi:MAG: xenobiotic-transporting ATPase, partial [Cytophaga sp.]|nr:xenobiotic-transporting ATPase [Cytophaga sp.]
EEDIFDGTIYDNITMGKSVPIEEVVPVLDRVGLKDSINIMPEGIHTSLISGGKGLTSSQIHRLILSRCLVKKPELLILNDFFSGLGKTDKQQLVQCVTDKQSKWTLVVVSNDPMIMASCDRVVVLDKGEIAGDDTYQGLVKQGLINHYFE